MEPRRVETSQKDRLIGGLIGLFLVALYQGAVVFVRQGGLRAWFASVLVSTCLLIALLASSEDDGVAYSLTGVVLVLATAAAPWVLSAYL